MFSHITFKYYNRKLKTKRYNEYLRDTLDPFNVSDRCFIDNYRLPKQLVHQLIADLTPFVDDPENSLRIPLHLEVRCTLNFFASGSHQRRVGMDPFAVMSQSKVSFSVSRISYLISTKLARKHIVFPSNLATASQKKRQFLEKFGVPGIVGLIDCTHIAIANINNRSEYAYVNRKGFHSLNVQTLMQRISSDDHKSWLFGDSGYALKPYMMVPFRRPNSNEELRYNLAHAKIRSSVERCFAVLKNRFRCLKTASGHLHYSHQKAAHIIYSFAVLHNISIKNNYPIEEGDVIVEEDVPIDDSMDEDDSGQENRRFLVNYIQERGLEF